MTFIDPSDPAAARRARGRGVALGLRQPDKVEAYLAELREQHAGYTRVLGDVSRLLGELAPAVLGTRTYKLDANGAATDQYRIPYRCIVIDSQSQAQLTAANMTLQSEAPGIGPGVGFVRPGGFAVHNFRGYSWSVYGGNPGDLIAVTAYATPQDPAAGGAGTTAVPAAVTVNVAGSAVSVPLFAPVPAANGRTIYNDSTAVLFVKFGAVAAVTSYTTQIAPNGLYEFPAPVYSGEVDGIWAAANGNARLTSW